MKTNIQGTGVALVTPFRNGGEVDFGALGTLVDTVTQGGADFLVVLGTTAETPTLSKEEKADVVACVRERNAGRLPIVIGIGGNCTAGVVRAIEETDTTGIDAVLSVTPYYNKPSQQGMYEHYRAIAQHSPLPVILYNVPGRTGVNLAASTTLRLAHEFSNIVAVKEACGSLQQVAYILRDRPAGFKVFSGDDNMALPMIALGADGVISVAANVYSGIFCPMVAQAMQGRFDLAAPAQLRLQEAVDALFEEGNPTGIKTAMAVKGMIDGSLRLPLVAGSEHLADKMRALIAKYDL